MTTKLNFKAEASLGVLNPKRIKNTESAEGADSLPSHCSADTIRCQRAEAEARFKDRIANAKALGWTECAVYPRFSGSSVDFDPLGNPPPESPWGVIMPKCELPNTNPEAL